MEMESECQSCRYARLRAQPVGMRLWGVATVRCTNCRRKFVIFVSSRFHRSCSPQLRSEKDVCH
jgi:hypothetical protein